MTDPVFSVARAHYDTINIESRSTTSRDLRHLCECLSEKSSDVAYLAMRSIFLFLFSPIQHESSLTAPVLSSR